MIPFGALPEHNEGWFTFVLCQVILDRLIPETLEFAITDLDLDSSTSLGISVDLDRVNSTFEDVEVLIPATDEMLYGFN